MTKKGEFGGGAGYKWFSAHIGHVGDDCLNWPFSCCTAGYGEFMHGKVKMLAHRAMCLVTRGDPPEPDSQAAHSCGNRRCINPGHLSWKSPSGNQLDRRAHGTNLTKRSKLNARQADQIRGLKGKETSIETAAKYGVTESNVRLIQDGKTWRAERKHRMALPDDLVRVIRQIGYSKTADEVSAELGVHAATISRIRLGRSYKTVQ